MNADSGQGQLFRSYLVSAPGRLRDGVRVARAPSRSAPGRAAWRSCSAARRRSCWRWRRSPGSARTAPRRTTSTSGSRARSGSPTPIGRSCSRSLRCSVPATGGTWSSGCTGGCRAALSGGVGQLVWERIQRDSDGTSSVKERNRFTICVADLDPSLPYFRGVYLHPRRGLFAPYSDWLGRTPVRTVEVESSRFVERYELRAATDQDELLRAPAARADGRELAGESPACARVRAEGGDAVRVRAAAAARTRATSPT